MGRRFVGLGFGAIQTGLFLREVQMAGGYAQVSVAMRRRDLVDAVNRAGAVTVNVAGASGVVAERYGPLVARHLGTAEEIEALKTDLVAANEVSVAVSSVQDYVSDSPTSLHRLLAHGIAEKVQGNGPKLLIYTSENHNHAADILTKAILSALPGDLAPQAETYFQVIDTVIGKMSRIVRDGAEIREACLAPCCDGMEEAFLVEAFKAILMSEVDPSRTSGCGIDAFAQKPDLTPFEHAKLHGHNATHAGLAYVGQRLGLEFVADVLAIPKVHGLFRAAFLEESGAALIACHGGADPLFTPGGYAHYVDDLLARMANPWLRDSCARAGRDVARKLGWDDRLIGTIRLIEAQGLSARRYRMAATAAIDRLAPGDDSLVAMWQTQGASATQAHAMYQDLLGRKSEYDAFISTLT